MASQYPAIIVLAPMLGSLLVALFGRRDHRFCVPIVFATLAIGLAAAVGLTHQVLTRGPVDYFVGGWQEPLGIGIHLRADRLNVFLLVAILVVCLFVAFSSIRRIGAEQTEKTPHFYTLFLLLCSGLSGITITGDAFNLFVLVEVSSLTSYGLVAMGSKRRGSFAAFNYLLMGTVGASFYLLGVGYLYLKTGTLNMADIRNILAVNEVVAESRGVTIAFIFIMVGIWIKMAFFPLHGWLPNAYTYSPSSSASLIGPLVTKVSVYVMVRMMVSVFGLNWIFTHFGWSDLVVILAVVAILSGSILALAQREIRKMLCYLIVAEVGYMVGGAWVADPEAWGLTGTLYHILADAAMTLCLFLAAGIFAKRLGAREIGELDRMFARAPLISVGFIIGALAMIGVPPTCGFFSKFYLIRGGIAGGHWEYVIALLLSSLINAILFFRIFEIAFFGKKPAEGHGHHDPEPPAPLLQPVYAGPMWTSTFPLLAAAASIILLGLFNGPIVESFREALEGLSPPMGAPTP
ncbi:MAG: monovalent cation/H+ antiporter subunit D family protein [Verrucomicrobiota bacterium]